MSTNRSSRIARLLAALMVAMVALSGGVAADYTAPPSVDTSGTDDTSTTSELQANQNRTYNDTATENVEWISDSNDTKLVIKANGSDHTAFADATANNLVWNSTDLDGHYNSTFSHSDVADVEHSINENVTMNLTMIDNATLDAVNQSTGTDQWFLEFDDTQTVEVVSDSDVSASEIVTVTNDSATEFASLSIPFTGADSSDIETTDRNVTENTSLVIVMGNSSVADDFSSAASDASSGDKLSGFSLERNVVVLTDDAGNTEAVPVYSESAPDDIENGSAYAVQKNVGGQTALVIEPGDSFSNASTLSAHAVGSAGLTTFLTTYVSSSLSMSMVGGGLSMSMFGLAGFAATRRNENVEVEA